MNALAGYILLKGDEESPLIFESGFSLKDETFRLIVGIAATLTGLMKILSPIDIPVIGDLFPAMAGILAGFILIFEYYRGRTSLDATGKVEKIDRLLVANKKLIGIVGLVAAALHFLFPTVLLL